MLRIAAIFSILIFSSAASAGFQSPESLVRNVYAYYGDGSPGLTGGLPRDDATARQFFDSGLRHNWASAKSPPYDFFVQSPTWKLGEVSVAVSRRQFDRTYLTVNFSNRGKPVALSFIVVKNPDGWVIYDVETPHDSLRLFLSQLKN